MVPSPCPWCHGEVVFLQWVHRRTSAKRTNPSLGCMVVWCQGARCMVCGALVPWRCIALVPWSHGALVPWCAVLWCHGAMATWCLDAMVPWCHDVVVPWCTV
ncbi:hypothetical protein T459_16094 [Capsicum annuum]|uniref:Uncharacterized protein n=1 Tax=Capsicum annuum TaxID=4072 RepID=A0A2G2Z7R6_CAPAN|nr:hypothetical protein T459_16094 [Capsicum annuum]